MEDDVNKLTEEKVHKPDISNKNDLFNNSINIDDKIDKFTNTINLLKIE